MKKLTTGMMIGGLIGVSSLALMTLDRTDLKRMQRKSKRIFHKAENMMQDMKGLL